MNIIKSLFITGTLVLGLTMSAQAGPKVVISTSEGDITLELNEEKAPKTVANFLSYVKNGFFDSTVFHRVIKGFMIQGGGFALEESGEIKQKPTKAPVENEAKNGLKNAKGTIAMARTSDPHSATAQFFINHGDNSNLDYPSFDGWGYAVFGNVTEGMDVVEKIANTSTGMKTLTTKGGKAPMKDVPEKNIVIKSIKVAD
jgi:cyclophilin family peptidyl-prolyl cis-trans isomerase